MAYRAGVDTPVLIGYDASVGKWVDNQPLTYHNMAPGEDMTNDCMAIAGNETLADALWSRVDCDVLQRPLTLAH